ncbi:hypothetical protein [Nocardioides sp.]|uniref:hypothetical protein n=1 Tax=Nocardioides sp. TaxID=35761 RepID=UPI002B2745BA|nr:hypothetical protein [Nocardioides sp.]
MTATATVAGASMLAHGLHSLMVLLGLWGLAALLLPHVLERRRLRLAADARARQSAELRAALSLGARQVAGQSVLTLPRQPTPSRTTSTWSAPSGALGLPLALVAATAAAGIHLAVGPAHLRSEPVSSIGLLIAGTAQLCWVASMVSRPRLSALRLGLALHGGLIVLWAWTRLGALPFGLLPERHPLGGWDVVCVLWEVLCLVASVRLLQGRAPLTLPDWFDWHPSTRFAVGAAVVVTAMLILTGAPS